MFSLLVLHSQQNILNIFTSSPCKIETKQNKKNAFQDHQPGQQLGLKNRMPLVAEPSGQDEPGPACSWVPACSWDPLTMGECSGRNLCAAQSGTLCSCNSSYEFNPYIFCRFIPHDLKERYSYHVTHGCYVTSVGDKLHQSSVSIPLCYSLPCCCLLTAVAAVTANSYNSAEKRLCQLCYLVSPFNHCQQLVRWLKRN